MTAVLEISALKIADHDQWLKLWGAYQRFYAVDIPTEVTQLTWNKLLNGQINGLGARAPSGRLLGIVHYLFHEDTWSARPACYLEDLYVDQEARGAGCARRLIEEVAAAAALRGAAPPYWLTHEGNAPARRVYDALATTAGFIQYIYTRPVT